MKKSLETILAKIDPQIFTEEVKSELVTLIESKIKAAEEKAFENGLNEGEKKVEALDEDHTNKLQKLIESIDTDHTDKLQKLVEAIDEDHSKKLQKILESIDTDHSSKLENLLESIDTDHSAKLQKLVEAIDEDHSKKLQNVVNFYETKLVDKISDYLDVYLEEVVPSSTISNTAKLQKLEEAVKQIRELLLVNDDFVQTEIREAVEDAKSTIDEKQSEINRLMTEKIELKKKISKHEATQLLESSIKDLPNKKQVYLRKLFENANSSEISEKLNEAILAFDKDERITRETLLEKAEKEVKSTKVEIPKIKEDGESLITEQKQETEDMIDLYVSKIEKSLTARK